MSKIIPRERVEIERRRGPSLSRELGAIRLYVYCAMCDTPTFGSYHLDHVVPLQLGGSDDGANLQPLCFPCHRIKTAKDLSDIARAKRLAGETRQGPSKTPLPFGRGSKLKKKLNGKVIER